MRIVGIKPDWWSPGDMFYHSWLRNDDEAYAQSIYRAWHGAPKQRLVIIFAEDEVFHCHFCGTTLSIFPAIVPQRWNPILRKSIYLEPKLCLCMGCWEQLLDLCSRPAQVQSGLGHAWDLILLFDLSESELAPFTPLTIETDLFMAESVRVDE